MSNTIINASTKRLVWLLARPNHADHAAAVTEATRRVEKGAKAAAKLEEALTKPSPAQRTVVKASARVVQSPSAPKGSSKAPLAPKVKPATVKPAKVTTRTAFTEPTPFQKAVNADPATYGEGFGPKRKDRGLAPLTKDQREARKVLYAELNG